MISLDRRGRLAQSSSELSRIAGVLSSDPEERRRFTADPSAYLSAYGMSGAASLVPENVVRLTSEECTLAIVCAYWVVAAVDVLAVASSVAAVFATAAFYAAV